MFRAEFLSELHLVIKIILIEYIQKVKKNNNFSKVGEH